MDEQEYARVYETCEKSISFLRAVLPLRIARDYAYRVLEGARPTRECLSSDVMDYPLSALLALQGMVIINRTLTVPEDAEKWSQLLLNFRTHLKVIPRTLNESLDREIIVATDGGCVGNGTPRAVASWAFLIDNYVAKAGLVPRTMLNKEAIESDIQIAPSNIRAELIALIMALRLIHGIGLKNSIYVFVDCEYVIKLMTQYLPLWYERGGEAEFQKKANPDLSLLLWQLRGEIGSNRIKFRHIRSHEDALPHADPGTLPLLGDELTDDHARFMNREVDRMASRIIYDATH